MKKTVFRISNPFLNLFELRFILILSLSYINLIKMIMNSPSANYVEPFIMERFEFLKKVGSGAYGNVWKVRQRTSQKVYALKKIFDAFQNATDAQRTFREIQILQQTNHPNIIKLYQAHTGKNGRDVYLLFQYMEADLHTLLHEGVLKDAHMVFVFYQIAKTIKYLHSGMLIHRDLKPANILVNQNCSIKVCDFGLVKCLPKTVQFQKQNLMTEAVATRWYRAPQVLLGSKSYSEPADVWSFGCIVYQVIAKKPLFPGGDTVDQIQRIIEFTGFPSREDIKSLNAQLANTIIKEMKHARNNSQKQLQFIKDDFKDLILNCVKFNPQKRFTIQQVLAHSSLAKFRRTSTETVRQIPFKTSIDDFTKLSIQQYKTLIEGLCKQKQGLQKVIEKSLSKNQSEENIVESHKIQHAQELVPKMKDKSSFGLKKSFSEQNLVSTATNSKFININRSQKKQKPTQNKYVYRNRGIDPKSQTKETHSHASNSCTTLTNNCHKSYIGYSPVNKPVEYKNCNQSYKISNNNPQAAKFAKDLSTNTKNCKKITQNGVIGIGNVKQFQQNTNENYKQKVSQLKKTRIIEGGKWVWGSRPAKEILVPSSPILTMQKRQTNYSNETQPSISSGSS